jgi:flagellar biosynthesis protein FlhF
MEVVTEKRKEQDAGKRYKLIVRSAEEAVRVIREKLGDHAKVLSVRQVGGEGLKRFISSPKLEVIAEIQTPVIPSENKVDGENKDAQTELKESSVKLDSVNSNVQNGSANALPQGIPKSDSLDHDAGLILENDTLSLLQKTGFDQTLLRDIQSWPNWDDVKDLPLADALKHITVGLSDRYRSSSEVKTTSKIALIGSPGVGKTTTLCKFLAHEVFMNKTSPMVLKVESGVPNPDDALRIFCEVVGVTLYRQAESVPAASDQSPLYLDFPGLSLSNLDDWSQTKSTLDELEVSTRVLVINGAYDKDVLFRNINTANHLGATHLAITHFDEISNSTKLWPLIIRSNLTPLCICNGQNVTGDFTTGVLNQMISRTFPEELYAKGFSSYQHR